MSTLNKVQIIGRLGDDPQMFQFEGGGIIAIMSVATNYEYKNKQTSEKVKETEWHRVVVRNKGAEVIEKYCKKGDQIYIEGRLKTRKWTDSSGQDKFTTEIICQEFKFLSSKGDGQSSRPPTPPVESLSDQNTPGPQNGDEDDLPF